MDRKGGRRDEKHRFFLLDIYIYVSLSLSISLLKVGTDRERVIWTGPRFGRAINSTRKTWLPNCIAG